MSTPSATRRVQAIADHLAPPALHAEHEALRIHRRPEQVPYLTPLDPVRFLLRSAMVFARSPAVEHGDHFRIDYATLAERVRRFANVLLDKYEVKKGDRVAVLCQNIPAFVEANFAVPSAGAVLVPLNTRLTAPEIGYVLQHSGASILLVQDDLRKLVPDTTTVRTIAVSDQYDPACEYEQLLAKAAAPRVWDQLPLTTDENALISINYTSGSTGRPKGVMSTYRGCYMTALGDCIHARLTPESVYLWTLPMFHCNGWNYTWAIVAAGGKQIMLNKLDYDLIWRHLRQDGVTHFCGAPTVLNEICNHRDSAELPQKVTVYSGGAALSSTLIRRLRQINIQPTQVYGLTETYGPAGHSYEQCTYSHLPEAEQHELAARQGFSAVNADEIRVLNRETAKDVLPNAQEIGEICMTGNQTMKGYYRDPAETEKVFRAGVFWTGDLAVRHPDGAIEIVDRAKDVIVSGGENISSIEVESVIVQLEAVSECAIVGAPDEKWGERPYAYIVLKMGHNLDESTVVAHCRKSLAGYKCPSKVFFVESIPKTSTGKVQKYVMRQALWKDYKKRIN
ncbi:hypothetical protein BCR43DRAFT_451192 [Syncephalastrum racemosum]|uniref:AMP-dependent synthetase and ligase n=1 Tax=Syncephalastrum racemosum TaxID=13706 RepID=A0A1X2HVT1_SYNRA|nr:hypothetical protein BCR43DRAFT_451192 [Syncephalastrum racemosum]